jgi:Zn-dependent protease with chaperone function/uncharacterized tellurite resistance protein B-like protein
MDFFQRQDIARRHTKLLVFHFVLAVIAIVVAMNLVVAVPMGAWNSQITLGVTAATLLTIFGGSAYKISQLANGGSVVAEMLGGRPVDANTPDPDERKFLNVVEEMAIASGTPVPQVYVLPDEKGINAFAAGHTTGDMVICATQGCLKMLTRDELQGVVAHEFSHILNGDMRLNLRLTGIVFGILSLAIMGKTLISLDEVWKDLGRKDAAGRMLVGFAIGVVLIVIGSIGAFFARLIKSAVSRQREFLADASAVQFTRNPEGLCGALKKIGFLDIGSRLSHAGAEDFSHLFFSNAMAESWFEMFSTHPPLEKRIRALDPGWDGKFTPISPDDFEPSEIEPEALQVPPKLVRMPQLGDLLGAQILMSGAGAPTRASAVLPNIGAPTSRHLDYAADLRSKLPEILATAARDPMGAVALIYALLLSSDDAVRNTQLQQLQSDPAMFQETQRLLPSVATLESRAKLPLVTLSMTALRRLSPAQFAQFEQNIESLIEADGQIDLFEYVLQKIVLRRLEPNFKPPQKPVIQYYVLKPLVPDCAVLLSALAYAGQSDPAQIEAAFLQGAQQLNTAEPGLNLLDGMACGLDKVDAALNRLNQTTPQLKKMVLNACAETVAADGVIQEQEAELLRAIADTLDCPIPPFLVV